MKYTSILFDLDGTLSDPGIGIINGLIYALEKLGIIETDKTKLFKFIGPPLLNSFKEFYGFSEEKTIQAVKYYREYYGEIGLFENEIYDGIDTLLSQLKELGCKLVVATSKPTEYAERILECFEIRKYFDNVFGSSLSENNGDKSNIIERALASIEENKEYVVMVGDRKFDIWGAKSNGIDSIGVLYGYGDLEELQGAGATYICDKVSEIIDILKCN